MLVLGIEGLKLGQPIGCHLKTKMGMQTKQEDPETKKKTTRSRVWRMQVMPTIRYYLTRIFHDRQRCWIRFNHVLRCEGIHECVCCRCIIRSSLLGSTWLGPNCKPQAWVTIAQQLQNLNLVLGLNRQRCKKHNVKAQCFCSSYHNLCVPRRWTLSLAGVLQTQFNHLNWALLFWCSEQDAFFCTTI